MSVQTLKQTNSQTKAIVFFALTVSYLSERRLSLCCYLVEVDGEPRRALAETAVTVSHTSHGEMINKRQTALPAAPSERDGKHVSSYMSDVPMKENKRPSCVLGSF